MNSTTTKLLEIASHLIALNELEESTQAAINAATEAARLASEAHRRESVETSQVSRSLLQFAVTDRLEAAQGFLVQAENHQTACLEIVRQIVELSNSLTDQDPATR